MALTDKQKMFVKEYLIDLNATQAAIRAGYSEKTANEQGSRLLANVKVAEAVKHEMQERSKRVEIEADWVLKTIYDTVNALLPDQEKNAANIFKGCELLGKNMEMWTEKSKVDVSGGVKLETNIIPKIPD